MVQNIIQEISEYSNRKVDDMTDDEIRKSIATFDRLAVGQTVAACGDTSSGEIDLISLAMYR